MGLVFVGLVPALQRDTRPHWVPRMGLAGAPLLGATFGLGWTPCLGPTLAGVIALASGTGGGKAPCAAASCARLLPRPRAALRADRPRRGPRGPGARPGCAPTCAASRSRAGCCSSLVGLALATGLWARDRHRAPRARSPDSRRRCDPRPSTSPRPPTRVGQASAGRELLALAAQHLARAHQHAHRADPAVPARDRRAARRVPAPARARARRRCDEYFTTHPDARPAARRHRAVRRVLHAVVLRGVPAAVHLPRRLPRAADAGAADAPARPRGRRPRATSPACPTTAPGPTTGRPDEVVAAARKRLRGWKTACGPSPAGSRRSRPRRARCARSATSSST